VTCAFNRKGSLLAVGCAHGQCVIWDMDTRGVSKSMKHHHKMITSVSWTRNSRKVLTSSNGGHVDKWDVATGKLEYKGLFEPNVRAAQIHPKNNMLALVCVEGVDSYLIRMDVEASHSEYSRVIGASSIEDESKSDKPDKAGTINALRFSKTGECIFAGSSRGILTICDTTTLEVKLSQKIGFSIKSISFSRDGSYGLVHVGERGKDCIRIFDARSTQLGKGFKVLMEFQDSVNRIHFRMATFSGNSDYVLGASSSKSTHDIFVWNRAFGQLVKTLHGPKEGCVDLSYHPVRPILATVSSMGVIYLWTKNYADNWSAFAPDFEQLEENVEYVEQETEFDIVDEEDVDMKKDDTKDVIIDIMTVDKVQAFSSDDEDELYCLPTRPIEDKPIFGSLKTSQSVSSTIPQSTPSAPPVIISP